MSDKKDSSGKFEPLKIETTTLKIEVKSLGDLTTKEYDLIPFHPNMADMKDLSNNHYILFPSFIKITMKDLKKAGVGDDYKKVFTNLEKFVILIKYVTSPEREEDFSLIVDQTKAKNYAMSMLQDLASDVVQDVITVQKYEPLTDEEIITNNIGLIKGLFFPVNGRFFVLGHEYIINESKYIPPYIPSTNYNEKLKDRKSIPLSYTITVELQLLDATNNPNIGDFNRLGCQAKRLSITNDVKDIFGSPLQGNAPEVKAVLPSMIVPTTTSKRGFGKMQIEWEERNKYVKVPTTEAERISIESTWTSQQKKMAKIELEYQDYNKIPPLWIKEHDDLNAAYIKFYKDFDELPVEYIKLITNNYITTDIENKIKQLLTQLLIGSKQEEIESFFTTVKNEKKNPILTANDPFIKKTKTDAETKIDAKYVAPFIVELNERAEDVNVLKAENEKKKDELSKLTGYEEIGKKQELAKVQAALLKKQTDYEMLKNKFGVGGEKLIEEWKKLKENMKSLKQSVINEKVIAEKKLLNESVVNELNNKMTEIKKTKEMLIKANYFAGNFTELTKEERDSFSKKPGDRPVETVDELKNILMQLEDDYLKIARKIDTEYEIQSYISLLDNDVERIKKLKKKEEQEKTTKDDELKKIITQLESLSKIRGNNQNEVDKLIIEIEKLKKSTDPKAKEDLTKKTARVNELTNEDRSNTLRDDEKKGEKKVNIIKKNIEEISKYETNYNEIINQLRKKELKSLNDAKKKIETIKKDYNSSIENTKIGGKSITYRIFRKMKKKKTISKGKKLGRRSKKKIKKLKKTRRNN